MKEKEPNTMAHACPDGCREFGQSEKQTTSLRSAGVATGIWVILGFALWVFLAALSHRDFDLWKKWWAFLLFHVFLALVFFGIAYGIFYRSMDPDAETTCICDE